MEEVRSFETSVDVCRTTRCYIQTTIFFSHSCENQIQQSQWFPHTSPVTILSRTLVTDAQPALFLSLKITAYMHSFHAITFQSIFPKLRPYLTKNYPKNYRTVSRTLMKGLPQTRQHKIQSSTLTTTTHA
jgi:hypothetical protein